MIDHHQQQHAQLQQQIPALSQVQVQQTRKNLNCLEKKKKEI